MSDKLEESSVIVSNLPFSIKEPDIIAFCSQAGDVLKVHLTTHSNSNRSKGWAIVTYKDSVMSQKAIETLNNTVLQGRIIYLKTDRLQERQVMKDLHKIYVVNIPWEMKASSLKDYFKDFNPVASIINCSLSGRSLGSGVVAFNTQEEAIEAKNNFQKALMEGREIRINLANEYDKTGIRKKSFNNSRVMIGGTLDVESGEGGPNKLKITSRRVRRKKKVSATLSNESNN